MNIPDFDPIQWSTATQSLVERMARAKWLTGLQVVTNETSKLNWTDLGQEQMNKAYDALIETAPEFFKTPDISTLSRENVKQPTQGELFKMLIRLAPIVAALQPPRLSSYEALVFVSRLAFYAREKGTKQPPETGGTDPGPRFTT
jgi:hypothetical protein